MVNLKKRHYISTFIMILIVIVTLYPFLNVLAKSLNDPIDTVRGGITIFPRKPTLNNYKDLFATGSNLVIAFRNSVLRNGFLHIKSWRLSGYANIAQHIVPKRAPITVS